MNYDEVATGSLGTKWYILCGTFHREDGPAVEWADGTREWWFQGRRHRIDGPAFIGCDGSEQFWVNGVHVTEDEFQLFTGEKSL